MVLVLWTDFVPPIKRDSGFQTSDDLNLEGHRKRREWGSSVIENCPVTGRQPCCHTNDHQSKIKCDNLHGQVNSLTPIFQ